MKRLSVLLMFVLLAGCSVFQQQNKAYPLKVIAQSSPSGFVRVHVYDIDDNQATSGVLRVETENGKLISEQNLEKTPLRFFYPLDENRVVIFVTADGEIKGRATLTYGQAFPGRKSGLSFRMD